MAWGWWANRFRDEVDCWRLANRTFSSLASPPEYGLPGRALARYEGIRGKRTKAQ
jgi:hypothetical protein